MDPFHKLLLGLEPERAHDTALSALRVATASRVGLTWLRRRLAVPRDPRLEQELFNCRFDNPVGLAAGFDKNAVAVRGLAAFGFGFLEIGTVTPRGQPGNLKPRIFRHPEVSSLQNALGFNNEGMERIAARLEKGASGGLPVGVNVGKNATTELERAESDYDALFERFSELASYFTINISSPNTPGLRELQTPERIAGLLELGRSRTSRPILVKLSPDIENELAVELATAAVESGAAGIILTNTTTRYELLPEAREFGGLSGDVLRRRSRELLQVVAEKLFGRTVLISVGGIHSAEEAYRRLLGGASLVQIYTALVYQGPALISSVLAGILERMERDGCDSLDEVVGRELEHN